MFYFGSSQFLALTKSHHGCHILFHGTPRSYQNSVDTLVPEDRQQPYMCLIHRWKGVNVSISWTNLCTSDMTLSGVEPTTLTLLDRSLAFTN